MSTSEVESYKDNFTLPIDTLRAYIYSKGYFSKTLLPYNPIENKRYVEIKCLLPINSTNPTIICNKIWKEYYKNSTTSNLHRHLKNYHPSIPRNKEDEIRANLEGI